MRTGQNYGLLDRRNGRLIASHAGDNGLNRACCAADAHDLTGYLSVVRIDGWGEQITGENLRPAWYGGRSKWGN